MISIRVIAAAAVLATLAVGQAVALSEGQRSEMDETLFYLRSECTQGTNAETGTKIAVSESLKACREMVELIAIYNAAGLCMAPNYIFAPCPGSQQPK